MATNNVQVTESDVSACLKALIELGNVNTVDDSPDKFIRSKNGDVVTLQVENNVSRPLAIFGTRSADALVVNPFSEGDSESFRNIWFTRTRKVILSGYIAGIIKELLNIGVAANGNKATTKKGKEVKDPTEDPLITKLLMNSIEEIDANMVKEFDKISKDLEDFFSIYYNKTNKRTQVNCVITNVEQRKQFGVVRAKTWVVLENILYKVLGVKDLKELVYTPTVENIQVFESFVTALVDIYKRIKEPLVKLCGQELPQLGELESHVKYLKNYASKASWCVSSTIVPATPVNQSAVPWVSSVPNASLVPTAPVPMAAPGVLPLPPMPVGVPMGTQGFGQVPGMMPAAIPQAAVTPFGMVPNAVVPSGVNTSGVVVVPGAANRHNPFSRA